MFSQRDSMCLSGGTTSLETGVNDTATSRSLLRQPHLADRLALWQRLEALVEASDASAHTTRRLAWRAHYVSGHRTFSRRCSCTPWRRQLEATLRALDREVSQRAVTRSVASRPAQSLPSAFVGEVGARKTANWHSAVPSCHGRR